MASQLYGATLVALLEETITDDGIKIDVEDQVVRGALVMLDGEVKWPPPTPPPPPEPGVAKTDTGPLVPKPAEHLAPAHDAGGSVNPLWLAAAPAVLTGIGVVAPASMLGHFTVFVLACFVGFQVVWNVKPALHTPLMSVTNAISGIILIGGMLQLSGFLGAATTILGAVAVLIATINIAGGFLVTNRMLAMFRK
jgi:NAD(P) transhydrogenase subunit alpha